MKKNTIEVFKHHSKTLNDSDLEEYNEELNDDDKRVQDDILSDIERDFTTAEGVKGEETDGLIENLPEDIEKLQDVSEQKRG